MNLLISELIIVWREFKKLFLQPESDQSKPIKLELAVACLLFEIVRADAEIDQTEKEIMANALGQHFDLDKEVVNALVVESERYVEKAIDMFGYTSVINEHCSSQDKFEIIQSLWKVALSDQHLAPLEEHSIRNIADLLYVPHSEFIRAKLSVM